MKKSMWKNALREIARTFNRYIAILIIVALGVAFYSGLKAVGPDMNATATDYFSQYHMMDYMLLSNIGFNDDDAAAVSAQPGIHSVMPAYSLDAMMTAGQQSSVMHVISLPDGGDGVNNLRLISGRLPQANDECVLDTKNDVGITSLDSTVTLSSGTKDDLADKLATVTYKVVGVVDSPNYLNRERGSSKIGNGKVAGLVYVPKENFTLPVYTELYATIDGKDGIAAFGDRYDELAAPVTSELESLCTSRAGIRQQEILDEANAALSEKQTEYDDAKAEQQRQIDDAQAKIDDSTQKLADGEKELNDQKAEAKRKFATAHRQLAEAEQKLDEGQKQYDEKLAQYESQSSQAQPLFEQAQRQIDQSKAQIEEQNAALSLLKQQLADGKNAGLLSEQQIGMMTAQIQQGETAIAAAQFQVSQAEAQLAGQKKALEDAKGQLDAAKQELDANTATLNQNRKSLADAEASADKQFADADKEIADSRHEIEQAKADLAQAKADSDAKLDDAAKQLSDARQEIADIPEAKWVVLDRNSNVSYVDYDGAIGRMDGIARVFPVFFYLIAALVCLTTMTRMVDEQRTQIGTLKALGYSRNAIAFKYVFYAASASILGSGAGLALGLTILPKVIMTAYSELYSIPPLIITFPVKDAVLSSLLAVVVTVVSVLLTCYRELSSVPASLMRPQSPKAGKRILLERIGFLWKRMAFSHKVTARNLFRYQKRLWMTLLGVACCCGMLVAGFGLKDSVSTQVTERQFGELFIYDLSVQTRQDLDAGQLDAIRDVLAANGAQVSQTHTEAVDALSPSLSKQCSLIVPMDTSAAEQYIKWRDPVTKEPVDLNTDGVILTQKLAEMLGVKTGDTVTIKNKDDQQAEFTVTAIAENYLLHYAVLSPETYRKAFGEDAAPNQLLANLPSGLDETAKQNLSTTLASLDGVSSLQFQADSAKNLHDILKSLDAIVWVIILSAALLAFVVLYTLNSITIAERFREIATVKVLGFYEREVAAYVFRESYILTLIGIALGMVFGVFLHAIVLENAQVDIVMFVKQILPRSFLFSAVLTFAFTFIVNRLALLNLRKINMVEALKGAE